MTRGTNGGPVKRPAPAPVTPAEAFAAWLEPAWELNATDVHLTEGAQPVARVDGELVAFDETVLGRLELDSALGAVFTEHHRHDLDDLGQADFAFSSPPFGRIRGNAFRERGRLAIALRLIPEAIPSLEELGVPDSVQHLAALPWGLVLVTGPTGAGKSTTLASLIDWINANRACHILTLEDPIEYVHHDRDALVHQREVGTDTDSFAAGLRAAVREDPDVILVGEMRDPESIATTLSLAETGHLVFATLHTNDSAQALDRIIDVFPADRRDQVQVQLSATLLGVVYQRLLPKQLPADAPEGSLRGQVAAFEVMLGTPAVRNLVREGKTRQLRNIVATHTGDGMQTLEQHMLRHIAEGVIDLETAMHASLHPDDLTRPQTAIPPNGNALSALPPPPPAPTGEDVPATAGR